LCSLRGGLERRAFSVLWEITPEFDIIDSKTRFCKSVIKSSAAMTYEAAQKAIDDCSRSDACARDLRCRRVIVVGRGGSLTLGRTMLAFAKRRKEQRIARGCLTLASAEVKFEFDSETHENITDVHEYAPLQLFDGACVALIASTCVGTRCSRRTAWWKK
jgi:exosome complex exonuclease DIS3/RRP44